MSKDIRVLVDGEWKEKALKTIIELSGVINGISRKANIRSEDLLEHLDIKGTFEAVSDNLQTLVDNRIVSIGVQTSVFQDTLASLVGVVESLTQSKSFSVLGMLGAVNSLEFDFVIHDFNGLIKFITKNMVLKVKEIDVKNQITI